MLAVYSVPMPSVFHDFITLISGGWYQVSQSWQSCSHCPSLPCSWGRGARAPLVASVSEEEVCRMEGRPSEKVLLSRWKKLMTYLACPCFFLALTTNKMCETKQPFCDHEEKAKKKKQRHWPSYCLGTETIWAVTYLWPFCYIENKQKKSLYLLMLSWVNFPVSAVSQKHA